MDSRTAAHVLTTIAAYLELKGENTFKTRAYHGAAKALLAFNAEDLAPAYASGELAGLRGLGPATLAVVRDLVETGESSYLEQLRGSTPEGLLEMLDIAGMTPAKIHRVHEELGVITVEELEAAAKDGRLAKLSKFGPKTAEKILKGIATARDQGALRLYHHAIVEAKQLLESVRGHPDVVRAELAGALRRRAEVVGAIDIVAACRSDPAAVAQSLTRVAGVSRTSGDGARVSIHYVDGAQLELHCVSVEEFGEAFWRATGNSQHVVEVDALIASAKFARLSIREEHDIYAAAELDFVEPELREGLGEVDAARAHALPRLIVDADIRGVLHCHSLYSDGKASIWDMAQAAKARGWSYIGITDHSQAAFYASGLSRERVRQQHDEIDEINEINATLSDFRILKGIEADILADGQLDYGDALLDEFDFVVGSIHSRFSMDLTAMTDRVLRALEDPRLTILAHPTGRLLLSRPPYALDMDAVIARAAAVGAAIELNADPHRLDLDWRHLRQAKAAGVVIEIGPDAHSAAGLDNMHVGIGVARKGWLERGDVLNTRTAEGVLAFARARKHAH